MLKKFWDKIRQNHLLMLALCCLLPIAVIVGLVSLFRQDNKVWIWFIILLCPILHFWMMRGHKH